jgi:hypothetical protein
MLTIIESGMDYVKAFDLIEAENYRIGHLVRSGRLSYEEAYTALYSFINPHILLSEPIESRTILRHEQKHFEAVARRNLKSAIRRGHVPDKPVDPMTLPHQSVADKIEERYFKPSRQPRNTYSQPPIAPGSWNGEDWEPKHTPTREEMEEVEKHEKKTGNLPPIPTGYGGETMVPQENVDKVSPEGMKRFAEAKEADDATDEALGNPLNLFSHKA